MLRKCRTFGSLGAQGHRRSPPLFDVARGLAGNKTGHYPQVRSVKPCIKVCGIQNIEEATVAIQHGVSALGLGFENISTTPGYKIREIAQRVPPTILTFLLTRHTDVDLIAQHAQKFSTNSVELLNLLPFDQYPQLSNRLPSFKIFQVLRVAGVDTFDVTRRISRYVDGIILDWGLRTNDPSSFDQLDKNWWITSSIIKEFGDQTPIWLAGGIAADNIAKVASDVQPSGFDLRQGIRTAGRLDEAKLKSAIAQIYSVVYSKKEPIPC